MLEEPYGIAGYRQHTHTHHCGGRLSLHVITYFLIKFSQLENIIVYESHLSVHVSRDDNVSPPPPPPPPPTSHSLPAWRDNVCVGQVFLPARLHGAYDLIRANWADGQVSFCEVFDKLYAIHMVNNTSCTIVENEIFWLSW